jgi:membrane fusion protein (multidrug efflux system)
VRSVVAVVCAWLLATTNLALADEAMALEGTSLEGPLAIASCIVRPSRDAELATSLAGIVDHVAVVAGQPVAKGDVLLTLKQEVARASLGLAETRERFAARAVQRNQGLIDEGLLAKSEVDRLLSELAVAQLERQKIAAEVDYLSLRAPFSGVVAEVLISAGEWTGEKPVIRLINVDQLKLSMTAKQASFAALSPGSQITMKVYAQTSPVEATVVARAPMLEPASASFLVSAEFDNRQRKIVPGVACQPL